MHSSSSHSFNEVVLMIRARARDIVAACASLDGGMAAACTRNAEEILTLVGNIEPMNDEGEIGNEGLVGQVGGRQQDGHGICGGRLDQSGVCHQASGEGASQSSELIRREIQRSRARPKVARRRSRKARR